MHSSSPDSGWKRRRGTPRNRGDSSTLSFGYSTVMCGRNWFLSVTQSPTHSSSRRMVFRKSLTAEERRSATLWATPSPPDQDHQPRADHVEDRQRDEPLPPERHELVVPVPRVGAAEPDVQEQEDRDLEEEPEGPGHGGDAHPREAPRIGDRHGAAEETSQDAPREHEAQAAARALVQKPSQEAAEDQRSQHQPAVLQPREGRDARERPQP